MNGIHVTTLAGGDWVWDHDLKAFRRTKPAPAPEPIPYQALRDILDDVMDQAALGKGKDRHANPGEPWDEQAWTKITQLLGEAGAGFLLGQAIKKIVESLRLDTNRAETELLGAAHYLMMRIYQLRKERDRA